MDYRDLAGSNWFSMDLDKFSWIYKHSDRLTWIYVDFGGTSVIYELEGRRPVAPRIRKLRPLYNNMVSPSLDGWLAGWWLAGWLDGWTSECVDGCNAQHISAVLLLMEA